MTPQQRYNTTVARLARQRRSAMRSLRKRGFKLGAIGRLYGCSRQRVHAILKRKD